MLTFRFDADQPHQRAAIDAIVGLFAGLPRIDAQFTLTPAMHAVRNLPEFDESFDERWLLANLNDVQRAAGFDSPDVSLRLDVDDGPTLDAAGGGSHRAPSFTIEMETGTGKTYVYLRSIYELRARYGLRKFVIVVPSVAIYEGVRKSVQMLRSHLRALYDAEPVDFIEYDGEQMGRVGSFARSAGASVLLMTLDAFNKNANKFYKASEKLPGEWLPHHYVQATQPIVILDEPQRMGGEKAQLAIRSLHPLATLRFSATHRASPNLCYRLTPVDAFRQNLVKRIQVVGVTEREDANSDALELIDVTNAGGFKARLRAPVTKDGRTAQQEIALGLGDDLWAKTRRAEHHEQGYVVENMRLGPDGYVQFANGVTLTHAGGSGASRAAVYRAQIAQTLRWHFENQARLRARGIKVLSLFFLDRVADYTAPDGLVKRLFDEEYARALAENSDAAAFRTFSAADVRTAYFAKKTKPKTGEEEIVADENSAEFRKAEQDAYKLIMRDKERLLSFDEPRCFVFAHSALREGWDNPNVMQICTLRESASVLDRRQAIGRGLRLCVDQTGARVRDDDVNVLTVIANESYRRFAEGLQNEYTRDGDLAPPAPKRPRDNHARRNDAIFDAGFREFWRRLDRPLRYAIQVDEDALIGDAATRLNKAEFPARMLVIERGRQVIAENAITVKAVSPERRSAVLAMQLLDDAGREFTYEQEFREGEDLARAVHRDALKPFGNFRITLQDGEPQVTFSNEGMTPMSEGQTYRFAARGDALQLSETRTMSARERLRVPNLVARAASELGLTRRTIHTIYGRMSDVARRRIFANPEGFLNVFVAVVRNAMADHVTARIAFVDAPSAAHLPDPEDMFPRETSYPQKEVVPAGARGLYDKMQVDSEVERAFVRRVSEDGCVEFYFKFPPRFRIDLPKLIGDNNPDWGIARIDEAGQPVIYKIRETKGSADIGRLRFDHEKRKVRCAQKYFAALGIDYRPITGDTKEWWKAESGAAASAGGATLP
jgi:type III restriction enzyme